MFCPRCGTKNPDEHKFCRSCGTNLVLVANVLSGGQPEPALLNLQRRRQGVLKSGLTLTLLGAGSLLLSILGFVLLGTVGNEFGEPMLKALLALVLVFGLCSLTGFIGVGLLVYDRYLDRLGKRTSKENGATTRMISESLYQPMSLTEHTTASLEEPHYTPPERSRETR